MKAKVKATGEIVEVKYSRQIGPDAMYKDLKTGKFYVDFELSILPEDGTPDYWTRLEHQYAGMAMQGILGNNVIMNNIRETKEETMEKIVTIFATNYAHALVQKLKEKEERK